MATKASKILTKEMMEKTRRIRLAFVFAIVFYYRSLKLFAPSFAKLIEIPHTAPESPPKSPRDDCHLPMQTASPALSHQ
jgi:hypothetical protein